MNSENKCISFKDKINIIKNCRHHIFSINDILLNFDYNENSDFNIYIHYDSGYQFYNSSYYNSALKNIKFPINTNCSYCQDGFSLNDRGECNSLEFEKCKINNLINNSYQLLSECRSLCNKNYYPFIYFKLENNSLDLNSENYKNINFSYNIKEIYYFINSYRYSGLNNEALNLVGDISLCYNISNEDLKNKFQNCYKVIYIPTNKSYICFECNYGYYLNYQNQICIGKDSEYDVSNNCIIDNNSSNYSCQSCYFNTQTLVTFETGIKECINDESLYNCKEAIANSSYVNIIYNCTSCNFNYWPYYSKFYQRQICQNVYEKVTKKKDINLEQFKNESSIKADSNGICPENYFTPDEENCYKCDNDNIGMPGCNGKCNFSLIRNNTLLCESDCKIGYLESSPGVCDSCNAINPGCAECHYENNNLPNYYGKRAREFKCDFCNVGYVLSSEGKCSKCSSIIPECDKCQKDENTGQYKCTKCLRHHVLQESGKCLSCFVRDAILNEKCVSCYSEKNKCKYCQENEEGNGLICKQCYDGYILLINNNSCLLRNSSSELAQFDSCLELTFKDGKFVCSKCLPHYTLLIEGDESTCEYIPTLFDYNYKAHYYAMFKDILNQDYSEYKNFVQNDYLYRQSIYLPCKEGTNLGTKENPLYSCSKCYNVFDNEDYDNYYYKYYSSSNEYLYEFFYNSYYDFETQYDKYYNGYMPVKLIENINNNSSICIRPNKDLENCTEAIYIISKGKEIYNCTKCLKDNRLIFNNELNIYYCEYDDNITTKCLVDFCKSCAPYKYYFCQSCLNPNYEINQISGSCVLKTEIKPNIMWKDIYRLRLNGHKEINGKTFKGPSLRLKGITDNQINSRHAFLINMTFKINNGLSNLTIPAICEIEGDVEENNVSANLVDYDCIGDGTVPIDSELVGLEGIEFNLHSDFLKGKNLTKVDSSFTINDFNKIVFFRINNDTLTNKNFSGKSCDFSFLGKINKDDDELINKAKLSIPMNEIEEKTECLFYKDNNLNSSLNCSLEIKNESNNYNLSFNTQQELKIGNTPFFIKRLYLYNISYIQTEEEFSNNNGSIIYRKSSSGISGGAIAAIIIIFAIILGGLTAASVYYFKIRKSELIKLDVHSDLNQPNQIKNSVFASQDKITN